MPKLSTHLWFDTQAKEAAAFYISIFPDSLMKYSATLEDTPSGSVDIENLKLMDHEFTLISAGPLFKINPSISFVVACDSKAEVDALWAKLIEGGEALMELGSYPFSERYGWLKDKFGVSWQLMFAGGQPITQHITPMLMFVGANCGKAEEAVWFYTSIFPDSKLGHVMRYNEGEAPDTAGTARHIGYTLAGQDFSAMDSAHKHDFAFNEAVSLVVHCEDQAGIDRYWEALSADPKAEQCGWLKDKFGVSWQVVPTVMDEMMAKGSKEQIVRVTKAFMPMRKFDLAALQAAYDGEA